MPTSPIESRTEERLARMIGYARLGTSAFVYIPVLFAWGQLRLPLLAAAAAVAATVEAQWVARRAWRVKTTRDPLLIHVDVAFCLVLMLVGSRAADAAGLNAVMTVLLPFALLCPALLGFGLGLRRRAFVLLLVLAAGWVLAIHPHYTVKLASDMLGFLLWFTVGLLIARELRDMARTAADAQRENEAMQRVIAEHERRAAVDRERAAAHREIHDYLLPIVEHTARSALDPRVSGEARQSLERARRFLSADEWPEHTPFRLLVARLRDVSAQVVPAIDIAVDPPSEVGEAIVAAAREALNNAGKHARTAGPINLYVRADLDGVEVVVRDHGAGFDPEHVRAGGGLGRTLPSLRRHGAGYTITSAPGAGTKVVIRWPEEKEADGGQ